MNIIFVAVAGYGWFKWAKSKDESGGGEVHISHLAAKHRWMVAAFICVGTVALGWLLALTEEARLPYYDAFATTCALSAQWMLSRKHIENWIFWILADIVYLFFFFNDRIWPSVILFTVFILLAIKGWREWKAIIKQADTSPIS
jgi:nicotinamide mononucleotide transporter